MSDYISRADAIEAVASITMSIHLSDVICDKLLELPSADAVEVDRTSEWVAVRREEYEDLIADAVHIHNDGTLEVKIPNAQKVGRVLVMDTDSHIGGGLFYPDDAVQGEWQHTITWQPYCSNCEYVFGEDEEFSPFWKYCPMCGARMKGGDTE